MAIEVCGPGSTHGGRGCRNLPASVAAALIATWVTFRRMRSSRTGCKRAGIEAWGRCEDLRGIFRRNFHSGKTNMRAELYLL